LLRFQYDKSKGRFNIHWPFLFNVVIGSLALREVTMIERQFTWANNLLELHTKTRPCTHSHNDRKAVYMGPYHFNYRDT
jgi:hypothetical protein